MRKNTKSGKNIWIYGAKRYLNTFVEAMVMLFKDSGLIELDTYFVTCLDVRLITCPDVRVVITA